MSSFPVLFARFLGSKGLKYSAASLLGSAILVVCDLGLGYLFQALVLPGSVEIDTHFGVTLHYYQIVVFLIVLGALRSLCLIATSQSSLLVMEHTNARLKYRLSEAILSNTSTSDLSPSAVSYMLSEELPKSVLSSHYIVQISNLGFQGFVFLICLGVLDFRRTIIAFCLVLLSAWILKNVGKSPGKIASLVPAVQREFNSDLLSASRNVLLIKASRTEKLELKKLCITASRAGTYYLKSTLGAGISSALAPFLGIVVVVIALNPSVIFADSPIKSPALFLFLMVRVVQSLSNCSSFLALFLPIRPYFIDALQNLILNPTKKSTKVEPELHIWLNRLEFKHQCEIDKVPELGKTILQDELPSISFRDVSFSYAKGAKVLNGVKLEIPAGSMSGFFGKSGLGKTTFLNLIAGIREPTEGSVCFSNKIEKLVNRSELVFGYCSAEPMILKGTVEQNLLYGWHQYVPSTEEIERRIREIGLWDRVNAFPNGLATLLTENGEGLSSGQKQSLGFLRALLRKPHVLILDEVSANLDTTSESVIADILNEIRGRHTIVLVSHREKLLNCSDECFEFKKIEGETIVEKVQFAIV